MNPWRVYRMYCCPKCKYEHATVELFEADEERLRIDPELRKKIQREMDELSCPVKQ